MIPERTATYVLVVICVFQSFYPSSPIRWQHWQSLYVQIGSLRIQTVHDMISICSPQMQMSSHSYPKWVESLGIDASANVITVELDGTVSHACLYMKGKESVE